MSEPNPLPYASVSQATMVDQSHLRALAICHYVWGALIAAFSCIFIVYVIIGILMASGKFPPGNSSQPPPPAELGYVFAGMGGCAITLGWTIGLLSIFSGRFIARQRRRTFSLVLAGINCVSVPVGTVLGVFTFIVLFRPSVRALYEYSSQQRA